MKKVFRKFFYLFLYYKLIFNCELNYFLFGSEGLGYILEKTPRMFLIPLLKRYGMEIGNNCTILTGISFHRLKGKKPLSKLKIGDNVYIGRNVFFDLASDIELKNDTSLGEGCQIWTHVGDYSFSFADYKEKINPVIIGTGCLLWARVIVNQGVIIGDFTRVAAGSVVVRSLESKSFYAGVPAKFIRKREI